jgi:hypothetical protein
MPAPVQPTNPPASHGKNGVLMVSTTAAGPVTAVALITEWSIDRTSDKVETTALGDNNKTYVKGLDDVKGTFSGQWDSTDDTLFEAAESPNGVLIELYPDVANAFCLKGPAWLDVSIKGGVSAAVTIDGNFSANGSWTRVASGVLPVIVATGATAGLPGSFTPAGATPPANLAAMTGIVATPATVWTTGQHVEMGDGADCYWNGTAWVAGIKT